MSNVWKVTEKGTRWTPMDSEKLHLVITPGGYVGFTDKDDAYQYATGKTNSSVISIDLNPDMERVYRVAFQYATGGILQTRIEVITPQGKVEANRMWYSSSLQNYCYVRAYNEEDAIVKAKGVFKKTIEEAR